MMQPKTSAPNRQPGSSPTSPIGRRGRDAPLRSSDNPNCNSAAVDDVLASLERQVAKLQTSPVRTQQAVISTGVDALDACLPHGGYVAGSVIEYLRLTPACGATYLALTSAASAMKQSGGFLVIVDPVGEIYPPALVSHGIDLSRVVFVRPESQADAIWAIDQALRTPAVAVVLGELLRLDDRSARRFQLAAQRGRGLGLLMRTAGARKSPSWAEIQWLVRSAAATRSAQTQSPVTSRPANRRAAARHLHVQLARVRSGNPGQSLRLAIDGVTGAVQAIAPRGGERKRHEPDSTARDQSNSVRLAAQLARPTHPGRNARAG